VGALKKALSFHRGIEYILLAANYASGSSIKANCTLKTLFSSWGRGEGGRGREGGGEGEEEEGEGEEGEGEEGGRREARKRREVRRREGGGGGEG